MPEGQDTSDVSIWVFSRKQLGVTTFTKQLCVRISPSTGEKSIRASCGYKPSYSATETYIGIASSSNDDTLSFCDITVYDLPRKDLTSDNFYKVDATGTPVQVLATDPTLTQVLQPVIDRQFDTNTLDTLEYLVIELDGKRIVKTLSLVCGSTETEKCADVEVKVANFVDLDATNWNQACSPTFSAHEFGAEFNCQVNNSQYIIIKKGTGNLALKNVAVYAGNDCYKAVTLVKRNKSGNTITGTIGDNPVKEDELTSYEVEFSDDDPECASEDIYSSHYAFKSSNTDLI